MVRCPFCTGETKVVDTRESEDSVRRRRECETCSKRFTTYERPEVNIFVIKKDNRREAYDRQKLMTGITKACEKRPVSMDSIENMINRIENSIRSQDEISSKKIGNLVMRELKKTDSVAYVRFASVYQEFEDPKMFTQVVKTLRR